MSLLGWVVGAALLDECGRREEEERENEKLRRQNWENERLIRDLEDRLDFGRTADFLLDDRLEHTLHSLLDLLNCIVDD